MGTYIRKNRIKRGYTINELAAKLEISREWLSKIENNKVSPSVPLMKRMADVLRVSYQEIVKRRK